MKKIFMKSLALTSVGVISFISIIVDTENRSRAAYDIELTIPDDYSNEFFAAQHESVQIYNQILEGFNINSTQFSALSATETEDIYPNYYGGAYINDEGNLVVLLTDINAENTAEMNAVAGASLLYEQCNVSYNEMCDMIELLSDYIPIFEEQGITIASVSDNIMHGCVDVSVVDLTLEKEKIICDMVDCSFINFTEGQLPQNCAGMELGGGYKIVNKADNTYSTIGFSAKRNGVKGFVIAGHACSNLGDTFTYNGVPIGSATKTAYYGGSTADAAFVTASSVVTPINYLINGKEIVGIDISLPINAAVYSYGATSGYRNGLVTSTNATFSNGTYTFKNQCMAKYSSEGGDSGGPVIYFDRAPRVNPECYIVGITVAGHPVSGTYFAPYANIEKELGITCITE